MDFDFGNLVYILLTIAFVIFSAKKKKKKPATQTIGQDPENDQVSQTAEDYISEKLKNLLGDFSDQEDSVPENEESVYGYVDNEYELKEEAYEEIPADSYSKLDSIEKEEGLSSTMKFIEDLEKQSLVIESRSSDLLPSFTDEVLEDFDARRAILFSEIFRPKYF